ncbi:hypothetical protein ACFLX9_00675 [Chloroflexota bacterium]
MFLTKIRAPIVATVFIVLLGFVLALGQASADDAAGSIPSGDFGDNTAANDPIGWEWEGSGNDIRIDIFLDDAWADLVYGIEVFVEPDATAAAILQNEDKPMHVQRMGNYGPFPTGRSLCFVFSTTRQAEDSVGIHLTDMDEDDILISDGLQNLVPFTPASTCASAQPTPQAVGTPTPTPEAPPTGDFAPGSGLVLALVIAGFLLIIAGGAYLTQARRASN